MLPACRRRTRAVVGIEGSRHTDLTHASISIAETAGCGKLPERPYRTTVVGGIDEMPGGLVAGLESLCRKIAGRSRLLPSEDRRAEPAPTLARMLVRQVSWTFVRDSRVWQSERVHPRRKGAP